jgi:hypothetical protein
MFDEQSVIYRYKFLPFSTGSLQTLISGTMKFSCALDFNDPFDCHPHFDVSNLRQINKFRPDLFKAAGARRGLSPAKRMQDKSQFVARILNKVNDGTFRRDQLEQVGIVCLTKAGNNILMWSHYADQHRGILLEFRIPVIGPMSDVILSRDRLLPLPVNYQKDRPSIMMASKLETDFVNKIVLSKSLDWSYEEEERVIDHGRVPGIYPYRRDDILSSVVAGMRIEDKHHQELLGIIATVSKETGREIPLFRAVANPKEYRISVPNHPRLSS